MKFVELFQEIWQQHGVDVYLRPYAIICCGKQCGLLENIATARSLDHLKKGTGMTSLSQYFKVHLFSPSLDLVETNLKCDSFFVDVMQ